MEKYRVARPLQYRAPMRTVGTTQALFLVITIMGCLGCTASDTPAEGVDDEVEFGLGDAKADGEGCDPRALLCWPEADSYALRGYFSAQDTFLVGAGDDGAQARALLLSLDDVGHKLGPSEIDAMPALRARAAALGPEVAREQRLAFVTAVHHEAGERVATGYLSAHAVALGASASDTSADEPGRGYDDFTQLPSVLTDPDVAESLAQLRGSGPYGYAYALLMEHTGVLEASVDVWDQEFPFSEPQEQRVSRIIGRYTGLATEDQVLVNLESLIPYAGIPLSISHGALIHFRHRFRMAVEIASAYGVDIREGQNLLLVTGALMGALEIPELQGLFGGAFALPVLAEVALRKGGLLNLRMALQQLSRNLVRKLMAVLYRKGAELAARASTRAVAVGAGRQVLGYATLGLSMIGDVLLTRAITRSMGEHLDATIRPWGTSMLTENGETITRRGDARCVAEMLGAAMASDGEIQESEEDLLAAHLSRSIWRDGRWRELSETASYGEQAAAAAVGAELASLGSCVEELFRGDPRRGRMALLSWLFTMFSVDGHLAPGELELWGDAVALLRGNEWFGDGDEIDDAHLASMRARIETSLVSADDLLDPEAAELIADLTPEDLIAGYANIDPAALHALRCAFGDC